MPNGVLTCRLTSTFPQGKFNFWVAQLVIWKSVYLYEYLILSSVNLYIYIYTYYTYTYIDTYIYIFTYFLQIQNISWP